MLHTLPCYSYYYSYTAAAATATSYFSKVPENETLLCFSCYLQLFQQLLYLAHIFPTVTAFTVLPATTATLQQLLLLLHLLPYISSREWISSLLQLLFTTITAAILYLVHSFSAAAAFTVLPATTVQLQQLLLLLLRHMYLFYLYLFSSSLPTATTATIIAVFNCSYYTSVPEHETPADMQ